MNDSIKATHRVVLSLGSNKGDRLAALRAAKQAVAPYITVLAVSSVYEMEPAYVNDQPLFLNAALLGTTTLDPMGLLYTLKDIEIELGRTPTFHYGPRVIDIDIVFIDDLILHSSALTIPHPFMAERPFVLKPLLEVCPEWVHPQSGQSVQALWEALPKDDRLTLIDRL